MVASLRLVEDRRPRLGGVRPDYPRQQVEPRFVLENQHPALTPRPPFQACPDPAPPAGGRPRFRPKNPPPAPPPPPPLQVWPDLVPPAPDGFLVPRDGPADRHLGRPVQLLEQPADVVFVVADAELLLDHLGDAGTGPHLTPKPVSLRAMPEELRDQTLLSGREFGRASGTGVSARGLRPAVADTGEPRADAPGGNAQRPGDVLPRPALPLQVQRSKPPPLKPVSRKLIRDLHTPILCGEQGNLLCAAVSNSR